MIDVYCQYYATQTPCFGPGACRLFSACLQMLLCCLLRWLDWIFLGVYVPTLSVNHVGINKDIGKRLPQLHVLLTSELPWQHNDAITFFTCLWYFSVLGVFFVPPSVASVVAKFEQILRQRL